MQDQNQFNPNSNPNNNFGQPNYGQPNYGQPSYGAPAAGVKSATVAGLLGIFLGAIGVHNFYLGDKKKGLIHVGLAAGAFVVDILALAILPNALSWYTLFQMAWFLTLLNAVGNIALAASGMWGLVEGIQILTQGDAGLAAKGYAVAPQPQMGAPMQQNPYAQPAQPAQPFQPAAPATPTAPAPVETPASEAPAESTAPASSEEKSEETPEEKPEEAQPEQAESAPEN